MEIRGESDTDVDTVNSFSQLFICSVSALDGVAVWGEVRDCELLGCVF